MDFIAISEGCGYVHVIKTFATPRRKLEKPQTLGILLVFSCNVCDRDSYAAKWKNSFKNRQKYMKFLRPGC